jgi:ankyrin repeat protein
MQMDQQPEPEGQQGPPAGHPAMSHELLDACQRDGDEGEVMRHLDAGESINCVNEHGYTLVMIAAANNHRHLVQALVDRGVDLSIVDNGGWNALHLAAFVGDRDLIELVLANTTFDINSVNEGGNTPVLIVLICNHPHIVQTLVDKGADLSIVDNDGWNVLHWAARNGNFDLIELVLVNTTIDINSTTFGGGTPIMMALQNNELDASKLLVEKGANLFMMDIRGEGERAIDIHEVNDQGEPTDVVLGPQVLQHALDLRWASVKHLLLISNFYETSDVVPFFSSSSSSSSAVVNLPQRRSPRLAASTHSAHLAASVFSIAGLVRHIAAYLIRTELIVRERRNDDDDDDGDDDDEEEKKPDDVKRRIEVALAANEEKNKRARM